MGAERIHRLLSLQQLIPSRWILSMFLPLSTHDSGLHDLRLTARTLRLPLLVI